MFSGMSIFIKKNLRGPLKTVFIRHTNAYRRKTPIVYVIDAGGDTKKAVFLSALELRIVFPSDIMRAKGVRNGFLLSG